MTWKERMIFAVLTLVVLVTPVVTTQIAPGPTMTTVAMGPVTTTSTSSTTSTTIVLKYPPLPAAQLPPFVPWTNQAGIACTWIRSQPGDKYLDRAAHLCEPVAEAFLTILTWPSDHLDPPAFDPETYRLTVLHGIYAMSAESGADPLANASNWGCPRDESLRPADQSVCKSFGSRVPIGWYAHMAHLVRDRSLRLLGYMIDPYDLYESSLLAAALVYEKGGGGWLHWWHSHWAFNRHLTKHGIRPVWYCPPNAYWANVRGGRQTCPNSMQPAASG